MTTEQGNPISRRMFANGVGTVVLATGAAGAAAAPARGHGGMMSAMQDCIRECQACSTICTSTLIDQCMKVGGRHATPEHVRIMLDCAEVCTTTAGLMARSSTFHAAMCRLCAEVCEACARSCDGLDGMAACIAACRACAKSCRAMAAMG